MNTKFTAAAQAIAEHFKQAEAQRGEPFRDTFTNPMNNDAVMPNFVGIPLALLRALVEATAAVPIDPLHVVTDDSLSAATPSGVQPTLVKVDEDARRGLIGEELELFRKTLEGFADCGETDTDYAKLLDWARRGLLECTNFRPTALAHRILDAGEKGGAA